jgi:hypothetical protein
VFSNGLVDMSNSYKFIACKNESVKNLKIPCLRFGGKDEQRYELIGK